MSTVSQTPVETPFSASPQLCHALEAIGTEKAASPGTVLFHRSEHPAGVFVIKSGLVRLFISGKKPAFARTAGPGSVLGLPGSMSGKPYSLSAEAVVETSFVFVDRQTALRVLEHNPELCFEVLNILSREVRQLREQL